VTINGDNTLAYDPIGSATLQALLPGQTLDDTFSYSIRDGSERIDEGTVTVTVSGIGVPGSLDLRALADAAAEALADEDDSDSDSPKTGVDPYLLDLLAEE